MALTQAQAPIVALLVSLPSMLKHIPGRHLNPHLPQVISLTTPQEAAQFFPSFDKEGVQLRPGLHLYMRLDEHRVQVGGHLLHAILLQQARARVFVAINACGDKGQSVAYYGQLLLCFTATYLGDTVHLCYVRWLHTASDVARAARRPVSAAETRGPFDAYRWATYPKGRHGHPKKGGPWYGVVNACDVMYRVHMVRSLDDESLFRLNTDIWLENL